MTSPLPIANPAEASPIDTKDFVMTKSLVEAVRERERPGLMTETKVVAPAALENFVMTKKRRLAITTKPLCRS
ncbi:hypothetical protein LN457_14105 [Xanthomonas phaseoli]|uniref:hypothetical protein n=1 Tax=Xanthomonas phaseoli TaxID=1985254 RepID=UPI001E5A1123|nr:hypothetical protein [Xanthomonas phaseoli]MCC8533915.1 hypothetical protein [Xanthomonas phaseoli]